MGCFVEMGSWGMTGVCVGGGGRLGGSNTYKQSKPCKWRIIKCCILCLIHCEQ